MVRDGLCTFGTECYATIDAAFAAKCPRIDARATRLRFAHTQYALALPRVVINGFGARIEPDAVAINLTNGDLEVSDVRIGGALTLAATNGSVSARKISGGATGTIYISADHGAALTETSAASVSVHSRRGRAQASAINCAGDVRVTSAFDAAELAESTFGDAREMRVTGVTEARLFMNHIGGGTVHVESNGGFFVEQNSGHGLIDVDAAGASAQAICCTNQAFDGLVRTSSGSTCTPRDAKYFVCVEA